MIWAVQRGHWEIVHLLLQNIRTSQDAAVDRLKQCVVACKQFEHFDGRLATYFLAQRAYEKLPCCIATVEAEVQMIRDALSVAENGMSNVDEIEMSSSGHQAVIHRSSSDHQAVIKYRSSNLSRVA